MEAKSTRRGNCERRRQSHPHAQRPVPAARKVLATAGLTTADIDVFEINEAFAVVAEKFIRDLGLDVTRTVAEHRETRRPRRAIGPRTMPQG